MITLVGAILQSKFYVIGGELNQYGGQVSPDFFYFDIAKRTWNNPQVLMDSIYHTHILVITDAH